MTQTLITHTDLDGLGSVVLAKFYGITFKRIYMWDYDKISMKVLSETKNVIMTDLSIPEEDFLKIKDNGIQIFDHHDSSLYLKKYGQICDTSRCGTRIFFEEYIKKHEKYRENEHVERFVHLVDVYDRWQEDSDDWEEALRLNRLFFSLSRVVFISDASELLKRKMIYNANEISLIESVEAEEDRLYEEALKELCICKDEKNACYGVFPCKTYQSIICNKILKSCSEMDYVIGYFPSGKISVRSKNYFDLTQLKGIRGHKHAMGGYLDTKAINDLKVGISLSYN